MNPRTIQRIENEQSGSTRAHTLECLAKALSVAPDDLTNPAPPEAPEHDEAREEKNHTAPERVPVGGLVAPKTRLAYDLVKRRYGVSAVALLNIAPLLFTLHAEASLVRRRATLEKANTAVGMLRETAYESELSGLHVGADEADGASYAERASIEKADLFGKCLLDDYWERPLFGPEPFDENQTNPFANYLRWQAGTLGKPGIVDVERDGLTYGPGGANFPAATFSATRSTP